MTVLISSQITIYGKVVAISTIERARTICTGETSAGYTIGNKVFENNKQAGHNPDVDFDADPTGKICIDYIMPEMPVPGGDNLKHLK